MALDPTQIPVPLTNGTAQGGPNGIPPSPQPAPASDAAMVAQDVANKYPNQAPPLPGGTPQMPTLASNAPTAAQPGQPAVAQPPAHTAHEALYARVLRTLAPPTRYIDNQGQPQMTKPSLSNSILSGAIAGMLTPTVMRQGTFGPVADTQQTAANAFQAGQAQRQEKDAAVQKQYDDMQSRKLGVAKSNADMMHLYAATMQDSSKMEGLVQGQVDNFAPTLQIAQEHDTNLQPNDSKAVLASGMTMAQALQHPEFKDALLKHSLIPDGVISVDDGHGNQVPTQTFSVIDPHVTLSVSKEVADIASQLNPQWKTAFDASNGSMKMKLGQIQQITNQVNSVQYAERIFDDAAKSDDPNLQKLGLKGDINGEIMSAVRQGVPGAAQARQALMALENAKAAGGTTADVLNRLINDPETASGRVYILNALGLTADKAQEYIDSVSNARIKAQALAKAGGNPAKLPAAQGQIQRLSDSLEPSTYLTPEDSNALKADIPEPDEDGNINMNQAQIAALTQKRDGMIQKAKDNVEKKALADGDPDQLRKTASNILTGSINDITKMTSMRGNARINTFNTLHDVAVEKELNPTHFSESAMQAKADAVKSYSASGKVGQNLNAFRAFTLHLDGAADANDAWKRANSPLLTKPQSWLAENVANDPTYTNFVASVIAPAKEYMNFLNNNRAEHEDDIKALTYLTAPTTTPAQAYAALQVFAKTADDRLLALGQGYLDTVGTTFPGLMSKTSVDNLNRVGVPSRAKVFSGELPQAQSWVSNLQFQTLNPQNPQDKAIAQRFAQVGGDPAKATQIAREHGYILNF